jgi:hypothetical protein
MILGTNHSKLSTSWEQAVRTSPVDKLLEQHCHKSVAGLSHYLCVLHTVTALFAFTRNL